MTRPDPVDEPASSSGEPTEIPYRPSVGILVVAPDGRVLVGRRLRGAVGTWQPPQGGIDPGCQILRKPFRVDGLLRKVREVLHG